MKAADLKVGDRVRITGIAGHGVPDYVISRDTVRVYKKLIARGRSVRINRIDEYGSPWYHCRFRTGDGKWEHHFLSVSGSDNNWVKVHVRNIRRIMHR